ncbi:AraC family transcriptional regulator [Flaviramulus sp. BrNp1-15]|uniref:helix-turn-helix domain-containing protein n=1 Tax=Flaviramulus sp. BrNp1-15 TaxID=2916754 RepID=UPI001EE858F5|nr:AraC family transcriptional regulator [Flaviramulus sp. BrNp1-15]ULC58301.1 AraC family transcriptional regulator [Flaviramulus sp. BrNp1-15]
MVFNTHILNNLLSNYVESIFHYKDFNPDHSIERVVPTGHLFLIFELDGFSRNTFDNNTLKPKKSFTKVWVSGMHKNYISISAHQNSEMLVVQFKPCGSYPFLQIPVEELNDKVIPAEELFSDDILLLRDSLLNPETSSDKFKIVENWLLSKFDETKTPPKDLVKAIEELRVNSNNNHNQIIEKYPNSQKHLIHQFKKYIGLTPKQLHRVLRFNDILQKIQQEQQISWTEIAYLCGFSDQSHFIKEFKHFSGFNPSEFIKNEFDKDPPNFFPLDREG